MEKIYAKKGIAIIIIVLFIGVGFTSVSAFKIDILEYKEKSMAIPSSIDVYTNCDILTPIDNPNGNAYLFPGYISSLMNPGVQGTRNAYGVIVKSRLKGDDYPVRIDGNDYYHDDWDLMIVSNYRGLIDNYNMIFGGAIRFDINGNASRIIVIDF